MVLIQRDVLQLMPISAAELWQAAVREVAHYNLAIMRGQITVKIHKPVDLMRLRNIDIRDAINAVKENVVRFTKPTDELAHDGVAIRLRSDQQHSSRVRLGN